MEEIVIALAQFALEILFPLLAEIFLNMLVNFYWPSWDKSDFYVVIIAIAGFFGACSGIFPSPIANHPVVQTAVVFLGPWILADLAERFFRKREAKGISRPEYGYFWKVFWFAFPFLLARSLVIHHQAIRFW